MPFPTIPTIVGTIGQLLGLALTIKDVLGDDTEANVTQRLRDNRTAVEEALFRLNNLEATADLIKADTANTLAHVLAHLPADGGGGGAGGWDEPIQLSTQANVVFTARQVMERMGRTLEFAHLYSFWPLADNPDFAVAYTTHVRWSDPYATWGPLTMRPRERPAGETVLAYLQRVDPAGGWVYYSNMTPGKAIPGGPDGGPGVLICLLQDAAPYTMAGDDPRIDTVIANQGTILGDVGEVITATAQSAAADAKVLAADLDPAADPRVDLLVVATADSAEADALILKATAPRVVGAAIPLGASGELDITGAVGLLITLADIPAGAGQQDVTDPVRYHRRLGNAALGGFGGAMLTQSLEYQQTYIPIDRPDITTLYWHVYPPTTATVQLITVVEG